MEVGNLTPIEQTTLLTEYARALDSRQSRPILGDLLAEHTTGRIDYNFETLGAVPSVVALVSVRAKMLDARLRAFIVDHPDAVIVDLGAGLSSAIFRVDPPETIDWYNVDLPAVIELREFLLPMHPRSHSVVASVAEPTWAKGIPTDRPTMVFADGLIAFLTEPVIISLLRRITDHFDSGVVAFNDYGPVSRANRFAGKLMTTGKQMLRRSDAPNSPHNQWNFSGFKNPDHPEAWNPDLKLLEESSVMFEPDAALFPPVLRIGSKMARRVPAIARKARVLSYRF